MRIPRIYPWGVSTRFDACSDLEAFADALGTAGLVRWFRQSTASVRSLCTFRIFADAVAAESSRAHAESGLPAPLDLDRRGSEALLRVCLHLYRTAGTRRGEALALQNLAMTLFELDADAESALQLCERAITLWRETYHERNLANTYALLSHILASHGDYRSAAVYARCACRIFEDFGNEPFVCEGLYLLGTISMLEGDRAAASTAFRDALDASAAFAHDWGVFKAIEGSARIAAEIGERVAAIRLCGYCAMQRETRTATDSALMQAIWEKLLTVLRNSTEAAAFKRWWAQGAAWTEREAIAVATLMLDRGGAAGIDSESADAGISE
jgi:tetratricopeptide (TPR) repeat protein